eukprot:6922119-Prymnesium_polylepis.1
MKPPNECCTFWDPDSARCTCGVAGFFGSVASVLCKKDGVGTLICALAYCARPCEFGSVLASGWEQLG